MRRDDDLVRWCGSWGAGLLILLALGTLVLAGIGLLGALDYLNPRGGYH